MRFDMPEAEAEAEAQAGPIRSRAHLGRQLVARLLTTSHPHFFPPPPQPLHTQAICQAWPM